MRHDYELIQQESQALLARIGTERGTAMALLEGLDAPQVLALDSEAAGLNILGDVTKAAEHLERAQKTLIRNLHRRGAKADDLARVAGIGRNTVYRWIREGKAEEARRAEGPESDPLFTH